MQVYFMKWTGNGTNPNLVVKLMSVSDKKSGSATRGV